MESDQELKQGVGRELEWEPKVDAANVGVVVPDGTVMPTGYVPRYAEKSPALRAADRLYGVTALPDEIRTRPSGKNVQDDPAIAEAIKRAFDWSTIIPATVRAEVRNGAVTLGGDVEWSGNVTRPTARSSRWLAPSPPELAVLDLCVRPVDERSAALDEIGRSPAGVIVVSAARRLAAAGRRTLAAPYLEEKRPP
jgi:BON domain-containing protein